MSKIEAYAGRPYGHVPGHSFLDVDVVARGRRATLTITWGSAQGVGCDQVHSETEYTCTGTSLEDAIEEVRSEALAEEDHEETRAYIHTACSRALREIGADETEAA